MTAVKQSVLTVFVFILVGMTLAFFFGASFVRFFVDDPEVIAYGEELFRILSPSVVIFAMFTVTNGSVPGRRRHEAGHGAERRAALGRPRAARLPPRSRLAWGPIGIWWSMFASNLVIAIVGFFWLSRGTWLHKIDPATLEKSDGRYARGTTIPRRCCASPAA